MLTKNKKKTPSIVPESETPVPGTPVREPIEIPSFALNKLRTRQKMVDQIQREMDLQFQQRVQPIVQGMSDVKDIVMESLSIPDIPHKIDLEKGIITFE